MDTEIESALTEFQREVEAEINKAVEDFNLRVKRFPGNIMAGLFNFTEKAYYEADKGSEKAPDIKFNIQ